MDRQNSSSSLLLGNEFPRLFTLEDFFPSSTIFVSFKLKHYIKLKRTTVEKYVLMFFQAFFIEILSARRRSSVGAPKVG